MHFKYYKRKNIISPILQILSITCTIIAFFCFSIRILELIKNKQNQIPLLAAEFILPFGDFKNSETTEKYKVSLNLKNETNKTINFSQPVLNTESITESIEEKRGEKKYKIIENHFGSSGLNYENFYVKNNTEYNLNISDQISKKIDIKIKKNGTAQVLIVHTHTSEAYMDKDTDFFYESFYARSTDNEKNITRVGNAIAQKLKQNNIGVIHDQTYHDTPSYNGSYSRSAQTIKNILNDNPTIQVVLDIHRDSIGNNETGKIKPVFKVNGKKAAQIMIISGCDLENNNDFPDWEYNLIFALNLQKTIETMYPGMTRPMSFTESRYNMHLTHGSILIEVGTDANTLEEAIRSGGFLSCALSEFLNKTVV